MRVTVDLQPPDLFESFRVDDWSLAFVLMAADFQVMEEEQFATEGGLSGGWVPLSEKYEEWKSEQMPGAPILEFSGLLREAAISPLVDIGRDSMTITIDDSGAYPVFSKREGRVVWKSKPAVAGYHQEGAGNLPVREVVPLGSSLVERWTDIAREYMFGRREERG